MMLVLNYSTDRSTNNNNNNMKTNKQSQRLFVICWLAVISESNKNAKKPKKEGKKRNVKKYLSISFDW